ncbi:monocarboxylate transporter 13-like isoform X1 [Colletes gigas]|uniref:monocarboxylate transporter 13-like isoform X1 n=1 Tax=Colletes gigas TaxID=935657 RepID=UPI001C9AA9BA|nr:monocarboxylate transporter 13-like isoform X1 [Colletes gigas]XP_043251992.1 monocarboxylate transporter 13-like isoform X1 [Colletes gigas]
MNVKTEKTKLIPPDGGWGWVVLSSALVVNFLIPGTVKSFGVLFVEFLHVFKASSTAASWMTALCYFLYNSLGPLSSILSNKYSYRTVTIIGGAFAACGMMSSYFANSVSYLYVSYGLMVGIGAGLTFPPTVYIVTAYFERLRGFANGLCISGSAIGTIVLPPFLQYLLDCFGYRGAVLIMGGITLNTLVCGMLYHPVEQHMITVPVEGGIDNEALTMDESDFDKKKGTGNSTKLNVILQDAKDVGDDTKTKQLEILTELLDNTTSTTENETLSYNDARSKKEENCSAEKSPETTDDPKTNYCAENRNEEILDEKRTEVEKECPFNANVLRHGSNASDTNATVNKIKLPELTKYPHSNKDEKALECSKSSLGELSEQSLPDKSHFFDLSVLRDPIYLVILISNSTSAISNTNFMILLPAYAISQGFDKNSSALLLSVVSALDLVGRISGASLSDIDFVPKYYYFVGGLGTSGLALALLPMAKSYAMLSFFCALFGLSSGMYIGITTVILADMLGTEKLSSSYGISLFVNGVLQLVGPPACGAIFESVGSYKPIFLTFGIILILGTALWAVVPLINRNHKKDLQSV